MKRFIFYIDSSHLIRGVYMKKAMISVLVLALMVLMGCTSQTTTVQKSSPDSQQAVSVNSANAQAFSQDIINCVAGTPWTYQGTGAIESYKVTYTIDGKTQYKGQEFCKVIGHVEGANLPTGYSWEYYFRFDKVTGDYAEVCYKISFPGMPSQEGCNSAGTAAS